MLHKGREGSADESSTLGEGALYRIYFLLGPTTTSLRATSRIPFCLCRTIGFGRSAARQRTGLVRDRAPEASGAGALCVGILWR